MLNAISCSVLLLSLSHDAPGPEWQPGGPEGNFVMYPGAGAGAGDRPHHRRLSTSSARSVAAVLDAIRAGVKRDCFVLGGTGFCGNNIVEPGEECDCGVDEAECRDRCCYPRRIGAYDRDKNSTASSCSRRAHTQCSPSEGPCCNHGTCLMAAGRACRAATECSEAAHCSGRTAACPAAKPRADLTACNHGSQTCIDGECRGSMCLAWNMTQCFLSGPASGEALEAGAATMDTTMTANEAPRPDDTSTGANEAVSEANPAQALARTKVAASEACWLGCRALAGPCRRAGGLRLAPGAPCDHFQGYCDHSLECRAPPTPGLRGRADGGGGAVPAATASSWLRRILQTINTNLLSIQNMTANH